MRGPNIVRLKIIDCEPKLHKTILRKPSLHYANFATINQVYNLIRAMTNMAT